ncbi:MULTISPECIES: hypothetical protein [Lysinibacillus]|uniref:Phage protein n=1 Tax=Lysinibacillus capsici TaxID=2115968 RepID=A0ABY8KQB5_9BACI|nr:hypothetical protein [Lysinibacillus capsici]WGF39876.1 hypothetical protein QBO96_06320 [Lysinibacillus capsici]
MRLHHSNLVTGQVLNLRKRKQVYELDENMYLKEIYIAEINEHGNIVDEDKQGFIIVDIPSGLFKYKWNGAEWIEGETEEEKTEREALQLLESLKPTLEELANAELEIKMLTILTELEVIQ